MSSFQLTVTGDKLNEIVANLDVTKLAVARKAAQIGAVAIGNLEARRGKATIGDDPWGAIVNAGGRYSVTIESGTSGVDWFINLNGPNPISLEYGRTNSTGNNWGGRTNPTNILHNAMAAFVGGV